MDRKWCTWLAGLAVMALLAQPALAEDKKTNAAETKGKVSVEAAGVADAALAGKLITYGRAAKSPMALATAAQILRDTATKDKKVEKTTEGKAKAAEAKAAGKDAVTAEAVFGEAVAMAKSQGDNALAGILEKESKVAAKRDRIGGPARSVETVLANDKDIYTVAFKGDELARVAVLGDGHADLDLYVYDENGHMIAKDNDDTAACAVEWTPAWSGPFTVKVANNGKVNSDYILLTN